MARRICQAVAPRRGGQGSGGGGGGRGGRGGGGGGGGGGGARGAATAPRVFDIAPGELAEVLLNIVRQ
ncbi:hypothetical protein I5I80_27950, partial [Pseudomonas aeruginosa]|nr:hypothetical protein [Pseudomonas aeruginosa]